MRKAKPNILCIVTDDQPREWFNGVKPGRKDGGLPKSLTPTMDALVAAGTVVDGLYTPSPLCVPSRFAYLTGYYPSRAQNDWFTNLHKLHNHPFIHQESKITPATTTLAQRMKALGYVTGAVGKNHAIEVADWEMLSRDAVPEDPDVAAKIAANRAKVQQAYHAAGFDYAERIYHTNPSVYPQDIGVHNMEWLVEGTCDILDQFEDNPFFMYVATTVPHGPRQGWKHDPLATPDGRLDCLPKTTMPARRTLKPRLAAAGFDEEENRADLLWLDDGIQAIIDHLKATGKFDNTILYFGTDHGIHAKASVYEPGVHIWGLFAGPGILAGQSTSALCVLPDIPATLLDFAGGDLQKAQLDGRSLRPLLEVKTDRIRDSIYLEFGQARTVISDGWKYVALRYSDYTRNMPLETRQAWLDAAEDYLIKCHENLTFRTNDPMGRFGQSGYIPGGWSHERVAMESKPHYYDADQLYYLPEDPEETVNLAKQPEHQEQLKAMQDLLKDHLKSLPGGFAEFKPAIYNDLSATEREAIGRELMKVVFH